MFRLVLLQRKLYAEASGIVSRLEDAAPLPFAIPFEAVYPFSTVGSPAHRYHIERKQKNEDKQKFHQMFPFLTSQVRDIPSFPLAGI